MPEGREVVEVLKPHEALERGMELIACGRVEEAREMLWKLVSHSVNAINRIVDKRGKESFLPVYYTALAMHAIVLIEMSYAAREKVRGWMAKLSGLVDFLNNVMEPVLRRWLIHYPELREPFKVMDRLSDIIGRECRRKSIPMLQKSRWLPLEQ